jgi:hypothetical protein
MRISGAAGTKFDRFGIRLCFLAVTVVLAAAGNVHGSQEIASQPPDAVREYILVSANGQELPSVVSESEFNRQEVIGGSIRLEADLTHVWCTVYRYTERDFSDVTESSGRGNYSQQGTSVIFFFDGEASGREGTLDGNTITMPADVPMVYRRIFAQDQTSRRPVRAVTAPDQRGGGPPPPPPPNRSTFTLSVDPGYLPRSFDELCDSSILIVEADVQSILAPRQSLGYPSGTQLREERSRPIFMYLETDAILSVSQVFKGPESIRQLVISQKGGGVGPYSELPNQYNLMQQGEHYILISYR